MCTKGSSGTGVTEAVERKMFRFKSAGGEPAPERERRVELDMGESSRWQGFQLNGCR